MTAPTVNPTELRELLAEPAKWQGVDKRGAWVASTKTGERFHLRPVVLALLERLEALEGALRHANGRNHGDTAWCDACKGVRAALESLP